MQKIRQRSRLADAFLNELQGFGDCLGIFRGVRLGARLSAGSALKVPLAELAESKEKVRSTLNRATRRAGRKVMTVSDTNYLYVWNLDN